MSILPGNEQPIATVKNTCWEFYRRIGDKTKASLRRVIHRVFCLNFTALTMNGRVYFVTRLWLLEVARCTQRSLFEATAGECDEVDTASCQMA
ncbi:unnamed protein product [Penicillium camemberti]|uniref:Str. FM013 n=1 Tax=Penicillium camemberti (strain FM 013) TaxID=1429867 RepID=A0A0G4PY91_PENC3|nr:unnamed protein product [Penicillium camemberti]CRL31224.1 unnamed protein product [Penicillium camemberti]